tara:strand:- start:224 stop:778 length:555 start_codon:yes stop_codon:yes gene_type:complete
MRKSKMMKRIVNIASGTLSVALILATVFYAMQVRAMEMQDAHKMDFDTQVQCIATNIYHEARAESELGMRAVAWVTLNRVQHESYPDTACDVVYQTVTDANGKPKRHKCQFSWYCDGKSDQIKNIQLFAKAIMIASDVVRNYGTYPDPTGESIMYHANYVSPNWRFDYTKVVKIDAHIFYTDKK